MEILLIVYIVYMVYNCIDYTIAKEIVTDDYLDPRVVCHRS